MTDPQEALRDLRITDKIRAAFIACFAGTGDYGLLVASAIANRCGVNEFDPKKIDPSLVAFWNWFLSMLGIRGETNLNLTDPRAYQDYIGEARALMSIANMNDVTAELARIGGKEDAGTPTES